MRSSAVKSCLLLLLMLTISTIICDGQLYLNVSSVGLSENQHQKTWTISLDVANQEQEPQIIQPHDFTAKDAFGNVHEVTGKELQLPPRASGRLALMATGKAAPRSLKYRPSDIDFDLKKWL